jgi:hypothetical protein
MEETLTVARLHIAGKLKITLRCTNACESMISTVRVIHRNVKNWSNGDMCLRWTAAGMLEAETRFRKGPGLARTRQPRPRDRERPRPPTHRRHQGTHHHDPHCVTINPHPPSPELQRRPGIVLLRTDRLPPSC